MTGELCSGLGMGPCFVGGLQWCHGGFARMPNYGPIQGDHRIYLSATTMAFEGF